VDSSFLPKIHEGKFTSLNKPEILAKTQFVLLGDSRQTDIPKEFVGALGKPVKPSSVLRHFNIVIGQATMKKRDSISQQGTPPEQAMLNVLLVEDNLVNQKVASLMLKRMKCEVTVSPNGLDAVNKVRESVTKEGASSFDIVLMDVMMPEMDGMTATEEIRKWEQEQNLQKHLPIIALTAHAMVEDKDKCLEAGMDGYLSKPMQKDKLIFFLNKFTKRNQSEPSSPKSVASPPTDGPLPWLKKDEK